MEAAAAEGVMIIPGHLISVPHLLATTTTADTHAANNNSNNKGGVGTPVPGQAAGAALDPCPFFRVSFATVGVNDMMEGFARLRRAILAVNAAPRPPSPDTPPLGSSGPTGAGGGRTTPFAE
jgi:hypothetical protein